VRINLVDDWRTILRRAWSVKFNVAAALFGAGEIAVQIVQPESIRPGVFAGIAAFVSIAATAARVMAQKELSDDASK
jgi:hypothetical protein